MIQLANFKSVLYRIAIAIYVIVKVLVYAITILIITIFLGLLIGFTLDQFRDLRKVTELPAAYARPLVKVEMYDEITEKTYFAVIYDDEGIEFLDEPFQTTIKLADTKFTYKITNKLYKHTDGHDIFYSQCFFTGSRYFVFCQLNVNWWTPSQLYMWDEESQDLILIKEMDSVQIKGVAEPDTSMPINVNFTPVSNILHYHKQ